MSSTGSDISDRQPRLKGVLAICFKYVLVSVIGVGVFVSLFADAMKSKVTEIYRDYGWPYVFSAELRAYASASEKLSQADRLENNAANAPLLSRLYQESEALLKQASAGGYPPARYELGRLYCIGRFNYIKRDRALARKLIIEAAELNEPLARIMVAQPCDPE
jgi:TPR repeat protein